MREEASARAAHRGACLQRQEIGHDIEPGLVSRIVHTSLRERGPLAAEEVCLCERGAYHWLYFPRLQSHGYIIVFREFDGALLDPVHNTRFSHEDLVLALNFF